MLGRAEGQSKQFSVLRSSISLPTLYSVAVYQRSVTGTVTYYSSGRSVEDSLAQHIMQCSRIRQNCSGEFDLSVDSHDGYDITEAIEENRIRRDVFG